MADVDLERELRDFAFAFRGAPTSCGVPKRPNGSSCLTKSAMAAGFSCCRFHHDPPGNRIEPGETLSTRMFSDANCCASVCRC